LYRAPLALYYDAKLHRQEILDLNTCSTQA
jgi:hypothetical protein